MKHLPAILIALLSSTASADYTTTVSAEASLQSYWKLWNTAGASSFADAKAGNTATPTAITFGPGGLLKDGEADSSASFNGRTSVVSVGNGSVFNWEYTQAWTIECICNPNVARSGGDANYPIFAKLSGGPTYTGFSVGLHWDGLNHKTVVYLYVANNYPNHWCEIATGADLANGRPIHLAATYSGSGAAAGMTIYVNGVAQTTSVQSDTLGGNSILNSAGPNIGYDNVTHFAGSLEAVAVYNAALSASSINTHYLWTGFAGFWFAGLCPTVVQNGGNATVTFTPSVGTFDGSTTITASMTDTRGNALGTFTNNPLTPTSGSASGAMTWTAPASEQVGILTFTNNKTNWKSEFTYTAGKQGGALTANGTGQWAIYVQSPAPPPRIESIDANGNQTTSGFPSGRPANYICPQVIDAWDGLVLPGQSIRILLYSAPANTSRYELRDRFGAVKKSGTWTPTSGALAVLTIDRTGLPYGAYEFAIFTSSVDANFGDRPISGWIGLVPPTSNLPNTVPAVFWGGNTFDFGGSPIRTVSEAPGRNSSGTWPYYVNYSGGITPSVSGSIQFRPHLNGAQRLTVNNIEQVSFLGSYLATPQPSLPGAAFTAASGTRYPITLEGAPAQNVQTVTADYSQDGGTTWTAVPNSWYDDGSGHLDVLAANYYRVLYGALSSFLNQPERISINSTSYALEVGDMQPLVQYLAANLWNRDGARKIIPVINWPNYRTYNATLTAQANAGATSIAVSANGGGSSVKGTTANSVMAGVRIKFPSTGETATVANIFSSGTPLTLPLTAGLANTYASGAQVIVDPVYEDAQITAAAQALAGFVPATQQIILEPTNEPNNGDPTIQQFPFYAAVQAAGKSNLLVGGPCPVNSHSSSYLAGSLLPSGYLVAWANSSGWAKVTQPTAHIYHSDCYDPAVIRQQLGVELGRYISRYNAPKNWCLTETGYRNNNAGCLVPGRQAEGLGTRMILLEPNHFPDRLQTYWAIGDPFAGVFETGLGKYQYDQYMFQISPLPAAMLVRNHREQVFGSRQAIAVDFGEASDLVYGNLYTRATGQNTLALISPCRDYLMKLAVRGGNGSLNCVDAYGNTSTVTVSGGQATVGPIGEPFYVQLQAGQTATPLTSGWGPNFAAASMGSTISTTGSTANLSACIDGSLQNYYMGTNPYTDQTASGNPKIAVPTSFPVQITVNFNQNRTINQTEIYEPAAFQNVGSAIFDYQWDYFNGSTWQPLVARAKRYPRQLAAYHSYGTGLVIDFGDHKHVHVDSCPLTTTSQIRLTVYDTSRGGAMSSLANEGGTEGGGTYPFLAIAELKARNVGAALAAATSNVINLTGTNTGWTAGSPGSPAFSVQKFPTNDLTVTSQSVTDSTHATISVNAGSTVGYILITDPTTGVKSVVRVGPDGQLNPANALKVGHDVNN